MAVGASVTGAANLGWQIYKLYQSPEPPKNLWEVICRIDWVELGVFAAEGAVVATLPDVLEPATSPNHRAFFHSLTTGGMVAYGALGKHTEQWRSDDRFAAAAAALSFLSHLYLDGMTPKGLPAI